MIINGDVGYCLLAAYIGGLVAAVGWLGPKVCSHLALFLYPMREPSELSQWLCYDDSTINIVVVIIIIYYYECVVYSLAMALLPISRSDSLASCQIT